MLSRRKACVVEQRVRDGRNNKPKNKPWLLQTSAAYDWWLVQTCEELQGKAVVPKKGPRPRCDARLPKKAIPLSRIWVRARLRGTQTLNAVYQLKARGKFVALQTTPQPHFDTPNVVVRSLRRSNYSHRQDMRCRPLAFASQGTGVVHPHALHRPKVRCPPIFTWT